MCRPPSGYNDDGKLTSLSTAVGGVTTQTVSYGYDDGEQPVTVTDPALGGVIYLGHDQNNRDNHVAFPTTPSVTVDRTYTDAGRPQAITVQRSGTDPGDLPDWHVDYQKDDGAGGKADTNQVQKITIDGSTAAINQTVTYGYNGYGQLTGATPDTGEDYTYGYDRAGQLCWRGPTDGTTLGTSCPAAPTGDDTVGRDTAGNDTGTATTPLTYNAYHQVATLGGRAQAYNDLGNDLRVTTAPGVSLVNSRLGIIARTTTAGTTHYLRSPSGTLLAAYGPGGTYYYATNNQGSITTLIDTTGHRAAYYRYTPYGDPTIIDDNTANAGATNPFRYIGGYNDIEGDGYTKLGARYYNNHGHFTQPDPKPGTLTNPLTLATYGYGQGDPMSHTDPSGRESEEDLGFGLGIGYGIAGLAEGIATAGEIVGAVSAISSELGTTAGIVAGVAAGFSLVAGVAALGLVAYETYEATS